MTGSVLDNMRSSCREEQQPVRAVQLMTPQLLILVCGLHSVLLARTYVNALQFAAKGT